MAQDGCQPMERFAFAKNGSAQKSWAFCPSSRLDGGAGAGAGAYPQGGTYAQQKYSVSGYVNGYNPSLPAYPPTRAQIEAAAKRGVAAPGAGQGGYGAANGSGGYSGEIADQMSAQIRFEQARAAGGGGGGGPRPAQTLSSLSETSGGLTYSGHGAWDGPAPAGDPSKPKPGTPYYVTAPPEPPFDKSKEDVDVPLGQAGAVVGRLPVMGVEAAALVANEGLRAAVASGTISHIACPAITSEGADDAFAAAKAAMAARAANDPNGKVFVSGVVSVAEARDPERHVANALATLEIDAFDLVVLEWPVAATLREDWSGLERVARAGLAAAIGLANASVPAVETVCAFCDENPDAVKPAANVVEAHPLMAHRKLVGVCRRYGVVVIARAITGLGDERLVAHDALTKARGAAAKKADGATRSAVAVLARWSAQRGVPFVADASCADAADAATALDFRLTNAQKVLVDAMEPPPRAGGVRFAKKPEGIDFEWDDPFRGGVARPGLDLEKMNLASSS